MPCKLLIILSIITIKLIKTTRPDNAQKHKLHNNKAQRELCKQLSLKATIPIYYIYFLLPFSTSNGKCKKVF